MKNFILRKVEFYPLVGIYLGNHKFMKWIDSEYSILLNGRRELNIDLLIPKNTIDWRNISFSFNIIPLPEMYIGSPSQGSEHPRMFRSHFAPPTFSRTSLYKPVSDK